MPPKYLVLGHITHDRRPGGNTIGGSVYYGAITARKLGCTAAMVTSCSKEFPFPRELATVNKSISYSSNTTIFHNKYIDVDQDKYRIQYVESTANPLAISDVPPLWKRPEIVHFGPLVGEIDSNLICHFNNSLTIASIQGWTRRWDRNGKIQQLEWKGDNVLPYVAAAICSTEDLHSYSDITRWKDMVPILILTKGQKGATLYTQGNTFEFDSIPIKQIDPTGAGDVFTAAFIIEYKETGDHEHSARFATIAAGKSVSGYQGSRIPDRLTIDSVSNK